MHKLLIQWYFLAYRVERIMTDRDSIDFAKLNVLYDFGSSEYLHLDRHYRQFIRYQLERLCYYN